MTRIRAMVGAVLLASAALLVPATGAAAVPEPFKLKVTCDPATGGVTTSALGYIPGPRSLKPVVVTFQRSALTITTTTGMESPPPNPEGFPVRTLTSRTSTVAVAGYSAALNPETTLYHTEYTHATVRDTAGNYITDASATCLFDARTTVTLTCDPANARVTAAVTGRNANVGSSTGRGRPARIFYTTDRTWTDSEGLSWRTVQEDEFNTQVAVNDDDNTWSDTGYTRQLTSTPTRYSEKTTVVVRDSHGMQMGIGSASCSMTAPGVS